MYTPAPGFVFSNEYMEYRKKVNNAVIPSISLIAIASILSSIAVGCCAFLELDVTYFNTNDENKVEHDASVKIGLYSYEAEAVFNDDGDCYEYPENLDEDSQWVTAKTFGVLCGVTAGVIAVILWGWVCCKMVSDRTIGKHLTTASFFATFACGMTFMFVNNDLCDDDNEALPWDRNDRQKTGADCSLAWGGRCAIAGCVFWFAAFLSSLRTAKILEEIPPYEEVTVIVPSQEPLLAARDAETATNTAAPVASAQ